MYTEEQYKTYEKYLIQLGKESFLDNSVYHKFDQWLQESNIPIAIQNAMDERFEKEFND
ncbi:MAG TPA: hypothetical protein VIK72_16955 [Clostridiaceae bacterium]